MEIFIEPTFSEYYRKYPLVLVDVGASGGLEPNWQSAEKYLQIIGFEPDEREFSNLEKTANNNVKYVKYLNTGLYKEKTSLDFYLTKKQQTSSIFKPNREFLDKFPEAERFDIVGSAKIETDTLDHQFKINNIEGADFIKIDTQGSELFILQGATETIRNYVFGLEVEVEFVELYQNQPLFADVDSFIRKEGFQLFDIQGGYWKRTIGKDYGKKRGQLIFGNALYLRKSEAFNEVIDKIQDNIAKKSKALKAISICVLYGYYDYALEVLDITSNLFDKTERQTVEEMIKRNVRYENKIIPNFKGKGRIANVFYFLWELLRLTHNGWATVDRKLGNL